MMVDQPISDSDVLDECSPLLSPRCARCQEFLNLCYSTNSNGNMVSVVSLNGIIIPKPSESGNGIDNGCFLCSQLLAQCCISFGYKVGSVAPSSGIVRLPPPRGIVPEGTSWRLKRCQFVRGVMKPSFFRFSSEATPISHKEIENHGQIVPHYFCLNILSKEDVRGLESFITLNTFTGSDQSLNLAKKWMKDCCDGHLSCKAEISSRADFLPTRLIDIGKDSSAELRLCRGTDIHPNSVYFTLSHCWGVLPPKLILLHSNLQSLFESIDACLLPNTFQDAFSVVRKLGGRYIWIDSLCIIQDSKDDWLIESAHMCDIYSGSNCNICATDAKEGSEGMFRSRMPLHIQQGWCNLNGVNSSTVYCVSGGSFWDEEVKKGDLYLRAWAYQERFLSKRNLHFGHSQLYWECREQHASEGFPKEIPKRFDQSNLKGKLLKALNGARDASSNEFLPSRNTWMDIVQAYTNGDLTYKTDRLVAVGGLAAALSHHIGGKYLAGHWEKHLPSELGWTRKGRLKPVAFCISPTEIQNFIAPSWSWASLNTSINPFAHEVDHRNHEDLCQILESHVDLESNNQFGQVCGGRLKLKADLARAEYADNHLSILTSGDGCLSLPYASACISWDYLDMTELKLIDYLYLLPICRYTSMYELTVFHVLVLYLTGREDWEFRRCGVLDTMFDTSDNETLELGCKAFRKFSEGDKSSANALDDGGKFIITIV